MTSQPVALGSNDHPMTLNSAGSVLNAITGKMIGAQMTQKAAVPGVRPRPGEI
jgi:hypothetical protein